jgi:hypothetical protein
LGGANALTVNRERKPLLLADLDDLQQVLNRVSAGLRCVTHAAEARFSLRAIGAKRERYLGERIFGRVERCNELLQNDRPTLTPFCASAASDSGVLMARGGYSPKCNFGLSCIGRGAKRVKARSKRAKGTARR